MYDISTSKRNQSGCSFGVKTGSSFARSGTASHVGPGAYGREGDSLAITNSKNVKQGVGFGCATYDQFGGKGKSTPGPGQYCAKSEMGKSGSKMPVGQRSNLTNDSVNAPGPGAYCLD